MDDLIPISAEQRASRRMFDIFKLLLLFLVSWYGNLTSYSNSGSASSGRSHYHAASKPSFVQRGNIYVHIHMRLILYGKCSHFEILL